MGEKDWWTSFKQTGKIQDYLGYKGIVCQNSEGKEIGENNIESDDNGDRNHFICNTDGRV